MELRASLLHGLRVALITLLLQRYVYSVHGDREVQSADCEKKVQSDALLERRYDQDS